MKTILALALTLISVPALACDPQVEKCHQIKAIKQKTYRVWRHYWTGPHIGANVGYGWATINDGSTKPLLGMNIPENVANVLYGGQVGYRWRFGQWWIGPEVQYNYVNASNTNWNSLANEKLVWTLTENVQLGYVLNPSWTIFLGAGAAEADKRSLSLIDSLTYQSSLFGADFEVGSMVALSPFVTAGIKYQIMSFGPGNVEQAVKASLDFNWIKTEESGTNPALF